VRFELSAYALNPDIKVIAPWREWDLDQPHRADRIRRAAPDPGAKDKRGESPFSTDANLLHTSSEGKVLEDPWEEAAGLCLFSAPSPEDAPDAPNISPSISSAAMACDQRRAMSPATLLTALNDLGRKHGIGRLDLVENRFVGMKSRGMYETPGGTILLLAHRGIEQITLDRGAAHLKDELMPLCRADL
jgi:argininosuccinate synthase